MRTTTDPYSALGTHHDNGKGGIETNIQRIIELMGKPIVYGRVACVGHLMRGAWLRGGS